MRRSQPGKQCFHEPIWEVVRGRQRVEAVLEILTEAAPTR
jgi:hypothetical protein